MHQTKSFVYCSEIRRGKGEGAVTHRELVLDARHEARPLPHRRRKLKQPEHAHQRRIALAASNLAFGTISTILRAPFVVTRHIFVFCKNTKTDVVTIQCERVLKKEILSFNYERSSYGCSTIIVIVICIVNDFKKPIRTPYTPPVHGVLCPKQCYLGQIVG